VWIPYSYGQVCQEKNAEKNAGKKTTKELILVAAFLWVKKLPKYSVQ